MIARSIGTHGISYTTARMSPGLLVLNECNIRGCWCKIIAKLLRRGYRWSSRDCLVRWLRESRIHEGRVDIPSPSPETGQGDVGLGWVLVEVDDKSQWGNWPSQDVRLPLHLLLAWHLLLADPFILNPLSQPNVISFGKIVKEPFNEPFVGTARGPQSTARKETLIPSIKGFQLWYLNFTSCGYIVTSFRARWRHG